MRCLEKQPADRPSAVDMWRELEASGVANAWTTPVARVWWAQHAPSVLDRPER